MTTAWVMHCHHETLFEALTEPIENRIAYIRESKPAGEIETRLRFMRVLTKDEASRLPRSLLKAWEAYTKAREAYTKAREAYNEAREAYTKAREAWDKAREAYASELEALHRELCQPGCPWDGRTLFPGK